MRRVLACLTVSTLILALPVPDASAAGFGGGAFRGASARSGFHHRPVFGHHGLNRLGPRRFGASGRPFRHGRLGFSPYTYGSVWGGYEGAQQNVFVEQVNAQQGLLYAGPPPLDDLRATTGIAPSPTPDPVVYVIKDGGHTQRVASSRRASRPGVKALQVGSGLDRLASSDGASERPSVGPRVVQVTVPRGR